MTPDEQAAAKTRIVRAIARGANVGHAVAIEGHTTYATFARWRRSDLAFDEQVISALRATGRGDKAGRPTPRSLTSAETAASKARVTAALVSGATLADASKAAGVAARTVNAWRRVDADFDGAVVRLWRAGSENHRPRPKAPNPLCLADGCLETDLHAKGLCVRHYHQWRRTGQLRPPGWVYGRQGCSVEGCAGEHRARGLCVKHYETRHR